MFPSRFLKCDDLQGRKVTVTIADVNLEEVMMVGGSHEKKVVLQLAKTPKLLIAGRTNGFSIALLLSQHIRVKKELVKLAPKHAQPVEPEEPEVDDDLPPPSSQEPDDFLKDSEPA
jgi:hypothetical protein